MNEFPLLRAHPTLAQNTSSLFGSCFTWLFSSKCRGESSSSATRLSTNWVLDNKPRRLVTLPRAKHDEIRLVKEVVLEATTSKHTKTDRRGFNPVFQLSKGIQNLTDIFIQFSTKALQKVPKTDIVSKTPSLCGIPHGFGGPVLQNQSLANLHFLLVRHDE